MKALTGMEGGKQKHSGCMHAWVESVSELIDHP